MSRTHQSRMSWGLPLWLDPVSVSAMEREAESMVEASTKCNPPNLEVGGSVEETGGAPMLAEAPSIRDAWATARQSWGQSAVPNGQNPHGVESVPKADEGMTVEPGNLAVTSHEYEMIETTDDRRSKGRSPRSSPRAGKPLAWRRGAVG